MSRQFYSNVSVVLKEEFEVLNSLEYELDRAVERVTTPSERKRRTLYLVYGLVGTPRPMVRCLKLHHDWLNIIACVKLQAHGYRCHKSVHSNIGKKDFFFNWISP